MQWTKEECSCSLLSLRKQIGPQLVAFDSALSRLLDQHAPIGRDAPSPLNRLIYGLLPAPKGVRQSDFGASQDLLGPLERRSFGFGDWCLLHPCVYTGLPV